MAARVQAARSRIGISPAELSRRSGLSRSQISRLENGQMPHPPAETLAAVGRVLGVSADYLLDGDCPEDEVPPDLLAIYRALSDAEREVVDDLLQQRHKLPDTPEGRAAFVEAIRVAMLFLKGRLSDLQ